MHTTRGEAGTNFTHNGGYDGLIQVTAPPATGAAATVAVPFPVLVRAVLAHPDSDTITLVAPAAGGVLLPALRRDLTVVLPTSDVRGLIADRVRGERISALEAADTDALWASGLGSEIAAWAADTDS